MCSDLPHKISEISEINIHLCEINERKVSRLKNLVTRRRLGVLSLLVALLMAAAGLFVSAPANAADPNSASVSVDTVNQTITYKQSYTDTPNIKFVVTDARGIHHVQVPNGDIGATETFGPAWGSTANVRFLDPVTQQFRILGDYALSSPPPVVTPPPAPTASVVTLCHATGDASNPYEQRTLDGEAFIAEGHGDHSGDIIPPSLIVVRGNVAYFPGSNWDANGQAIFNNSCIVQVTTPTETAQPTPTETPTTDPLPDDTDRKIRICHATHPRAEAYEPKEVPITAILVGHGQHEGDIIPPFPYVQDGLAGGYAGNRWDEEGIAIYNNGCTVIPVTTPSPTETTTPTETAQPSPSETTSPTTTTTPTETTSPTASSSPTETATQVPTSAAPSTSQAAIPVKSKTAVAAATVSRYPAAVIDTAVKGGGNTASPIALLLFGGAAIALLMALLLFRSAGPEGRRH